MAKGKRRSSCKKKGKWTKTHGTTWKDVDRLIRLAQELSKTQTSEVVFDPT